MSHCGIAHNNTFFLREPLGYQRSACDITGAHSSDSTYAEGKGVHKQTVCMSHSKVTCTCQDQAEKEVALRADLTVQRSHNKKEDDADHSRYCSHIQNACLAGIPNFSATAGATMLELSLTIPA